MADLAEGETVIPHPPLPLPAIHELPTLLSLLVLPLAAAPDASEEVKLKLLFLCLKKEEHSKHLLDHKLLFVLLFSNNFFRKI